VATLGAEREGSGILIGADGLIPDNRLFDAGKTHAAEIITNDQRSLAAEVVGYDHETGFWPAQGSGGVETCARSRSANRTSSRSAIPFLVASFGGAGHGGARPSWWPSASFAGSWEYLLRGGDFLRHRRIPPGAVPRSSIARASSSASASLIVGDARRRHARQTCLCPIDRLPPINGRSFFPRAACKARRDRGWV
jgi:hypothetical protein